MGQSTAEWETPQALFDKLNKAFGFETDLCATRQNAKCVDFFTIEDDALSQERRDRCWMNPPYDRTIRRWVKKAYESAQVGALIVCLLPAKTDTAWWQDYATKGDITFIRGRLKFNCSKDNAPFPSAIVIFWPKP